MLKIIHLISLTLTSSWLSTAAYAAGGTHCTSHEQIIFSCKVNNSAKVVSLCASSPLSKERGSLAYRFGRAGKPELVYPKTAANSLGAFRLAHYFRAQVDRAELSFNNGGYEYTVFDYNDAQEKPPRQRGVRIHKTTGQGGDAALLCTGAVQSELQKLEDLVPCDKDNALANCR
jgi:hypothetical protein